MNPLLQESTLPFHFPPFDRIRDEHFQPAVDQGMREQLREIESIAGCAAAPTFENTVVALERSGRLLERAMQVFANLAGAHTNPELQKVQRALAPKLAAHGDAIRLNPALFTRIKELYDARETLQLDREAAYLLDRYYKDFRRSGAHLPEQEKVKLRSLNTELATLQTTFQQNLLKELNVTTVLVQNRDELAGLSEAEIAAAAAAAESEGNEGRYLFRLQNTTGQPLLASLQNRSLRQRILTASLTRNTRGEFDNRPIALRIARLRAERARLLGYANHAAYSLEEQTAGSVQTVNQMLAGMAPSAVRNARRELADLQRVVDEEKGGFQVNAADWDFYSEKVRKARFAFDETQLRPYLELNRVLIDGVFFAASREFGLTFQERHDLPVYHPDVRVFDVFEAGGTQLAIFVLDLFARPSKKGGAWMSSYVSQSKLLEQKPIIANHLNVPKPPEGEPVLLTWDEVRTLFHEFGHGLHGMFSDVTYPRFSGTSVPRDFVEFPSQVNELWREWPDVLKNYARHHQTGEQMPASMLDKLLSAAQFNEGYRTTEYLAAALLDQAWHQLTPEQIPADAEAFEAETLKKAGIDLAAVPPRYRSQYFSHSFAGGYSAGYYSYLWSEVMDADAAEWFREHGGLTRENGDRIRSLVLSRGGSEDAMGMYRKFRGSEPKLEPLLKRRGLEAGAK